MTEIQQSVKPALSADKEHVAIGLLSSEWIRSSKAFRASIASIVSVFGVFVWTAFFTVPPPNPWMMGETAFTRILGIYAVAIGGSLAICFVMPLADWMLKTNWFRWLCLPCAAYLVLLLVRALLGFPLSIG